jgi:hypothetical protein
MTIIKQFISICASLFSVLKINIRIFLYKLLTKNKVIFFYHPKKINKNNICNCCRGKQKTAYGFIWEYKK